MFTIQRCRIKVPGVMSFSKFDDLVHLGLFGLCIYVRAGQRRKLFGIVWGNN